MKAFIKKPVVWLVTAVVIGGGLTPVFAENGTETKVLASNIEETVALTNVKQVSNEQGDYIKANVTEDVTKVIVLLPNDRKIEITNFPDLSFTAAIPASAVTAGQTVTILAYNQAELIDTAKIRLTDGTVSDDMLAYAYARYDQHEGELKLNGLVDPKTDRVVVRFAGETSDAKLTRTWEGAKSFEWTKKVKEIDESDLVVELYAENSLLSAQKVSIVNAPDDSVKPAATIQGTAQLSAKSKQVEVKGTITVQKGDKKGKWKLVATAPDGKKHEIKLKENGSFEAKLPYQNRSFSSKAVHLELYLDETLVAKADIAHGVPVNKPVPSQPAKPVKPVKAEQNGKAKQKHEEKHEDKHKNKWKTKGKHEGKHDDDDWDEGEDD